MLFTGTLSLAIIFPLLVSLYLTVSYNIASIPKVEGYSIDHAQLMSVWKFSGVQQQVAQQVLISTDISGRVGVAATSVGYTNMAVVYIDGNRKIVKEGDVISGIKVLRINKDYVEFMAGGQRTKVKLGYIPPPPSQTPGGFPVNNLPPLENVMPPQSSGSNIIPKSELERLTSDPGIMFTQIRLIPFVEDGRTKGFRFDWIAEGSLFQRMGINVGDILVSINNQPINSGEDAFRILQIIRNERSFKIAILRNGQPVELAYMVN